MDWLLNLMRPDLRAMAAYSSARGEAGGFVPSIGIDANEFPWRPFGPLAGYDPLNRYPEPQPEALLARMAAVWNVHPAQILIGRGSDEGIDVLLRLFCRAGVDKIVICPPTYGMYQVAAAIQGAEVTRVPLTAEGQLDLPKIEAACTPETKLIFIPSPNAPMGHVMRKADLLALCKARAGKSLIVVDEAYVEFGDGDAVDAMIAELPNYPNLVILRTLSKAHALAGERVGVVIASAEIVAHLRKIHAPYPLPHSAIRAAMDTLSPNGLIQNAARRRQIVAERERMARELARCALVTKVFPSAANFLLVQTTDAAAFMERLRRDGILARDRSKEIPGTVRLSIGTPQENDLVLRALGVEPAATAPAQRLFSVRRATKETAIDVTVNLDRPDFQDIATGIGFFDHMLAQLSTHGGFGLALRCTGDLHIDQHHTIEDCALALGEALKGALGDKRGIARFGAPLDEALAQVVIDLSGRPFCSFAGAFPVEQIGGMTREMIPHFFQSLSAALLATIHIEVKGDNAHHMAEACFKATGRALRQAFRREGDALPSTKGVL